MTISTQTLIILEQESARAPAVMLERWIRFIEAGLPQAAPEVVEHARVLILKLEYLMRDQRASSEPAMLAPELLAPPVGFPEAA